MLLSCSYGYSGNFCAKENFAYHRFSIRYVGTYKKPNMFLDLINSKCCEQKYHGFFFFFTVVQGENIILY